MVRQGLPSGLPTPHQGYATPTTGATYPPQHSIFKDNTIHKTGEKEKEKERENHKKLEERKKMRGQKCGRKKSYKFAWKAESGCPASPQTLNNEPQGPTPPTTLSPSPSP